MYCQNCGAEINEDTTVCPYCGLLSKGSSIIQEKDLKIQALEQKIVELELAFQQVSRRRNRKSGITQFQPWIFIFPILFVVVFFVFFIVLVSL